MAPLTMIPIGFGVLALLLVLLAFDAFRRRRTAAGVVQVLVGLLFASLASIGGLVALGTAGYQALTRETVAATATVAPQGDGSHLVSLRLADGTQQTFLIRGDELYVDARILKWHPMANVVGLHTGYALDRISGRYVELDAEQTQPRTVYQVTTEPPVDLFGIVRANPFLSRFVDATYGSGTFAPIREGSVYEIRVSTTGLLVRSVE